MLADGVLSAAPPSHERTAGDIMAIVGCPHEVAPQRAKSGRGLLPFTCLSGGCPGRGPGFEKGGFYVLVAH